MAARTQLILICAAALLFRLVLLFALVDNPGVHDPIHYTNLGYRLADGQGFTIDYVWHYNTLHDDIVHPIDHWMPLPGVLVAGAVSLFGQSIQVALLPFVLVGALLPALVYAAARLMRLEPADSLSAALFAAFLPDFVINSLRTDTTIVAAFLVSGSIVLLVRGLQRGGWWTYVLSGVLAGLAYLTRNDAFLLLPMLIVTLLAYLLWGRKSGYAVRNWSLALLIPVVALLVVSPWLLRNAEVLGQIGPAETSRMFFMTDQRQHFAYDTEITFETMLEQATPADLIAKRLFELAAAFKQMIVSLDAVLPVAVAGGLLLLIARRERERLLALSPALILLLGTLVAYPLLIPYKSQSGSFEKAYLSLLPLLMPIAAYAFSVAIPQARIRFVAVGLTALLMLSNSFDFVRSETTFANAYHTYIQAVAEDVRALPDTNGDGEIRLMTQDPYAFAYYGLRAAMTPLASREGVLEAAARYRIDYLMFPAGRPALDPLYKGRESDPRFERILVIDDAGTNTVEIYALAANSDS